MPADPAAAGRRLAHRSPAGGAGKPRAKWSQTVARSIHRCIDSSQPTRSAPGGTGRQSNRPRSRTIAARGRRPNRRCCRNSGRSEPNFRPAGTLANINSALAFDPHPAFQPAGGRADDGASAPLACLAVTAVNPFRLAGGDRPQPTAMTFRYPFHADRPRFAPRRRPSSSLDGCAVEPWRLSGAKRVVTAGKRVDDPADNSGIPNCDREARKCHSSAGSSSG
jgi:hypothetical protein